MYLFLSIYLFFLDICGSSVYTLFYLFIAESGMQLSA